MSSTFFISLFFLKFLYVKCELVKFENCTFIFSNGDYEEFRTEFWRFQACSSEKKRLSIKFVNYSLPAFPNGTFANLPYLDNFRLEMDRSQIRMLSPLLPQYLVFENLKFRTAELVIRDSGSLNGWKWKALSEVKSMQKFEFYARRSKMTHLDSSFGEIAGGQLTHIRILNCQLRWLSENAFRPFSKLQTLELQKNFIEKFERFHLPQDASNLRTLDLSDNLLQSISWDVFKDLKVEEIYLENNNIKILNSEIDKIIAAKSLAVIDGVQWPCNCRKLKDILKRFNIKEEYCYRKTNSREIKEIQHFMKIACKHYI